MFARAGLVRLRPRAALALAIEMFEDLTTASNIVAGGSTPGRIPEGMGTVLTSSHLPDSNRRVPTSGDRDVPASPLTREGGPLAVGLQIPQ